MAKMRFDPSSDGIDDIPWTKLATIAEHLEACAPSHLSSWFRDAIEYANGDPEDFLHRLGLTNRRGKSEADWPNEIVYKMGQAVVFLEAYGWKSNKAIEAVLDVYSNQNDADAPSPSTTTLRRWRDEYRACKGEAVTGIIWSLPVQDAVNP